MLPPRIFTIQLSSVLISELLMFRNVSCSPTEAQALCYNDGGKVALSDSACNPHLEHSMCCRRYWTCLDNGICSAENTTEFNDLPFSFARATCTDPHWESPACPRFCLNGIHHILVLVIWAFVAGLTYATSVGRAVKFSDTNDTFCCRHKDVGVCVPDPTVKALKRGVPVTTMDIILSSGLAYLVSGMQTAPISPLKTPVTTRTAARPTPGTMQSVRSHFLGNLTSSARSTSLQDTPSISPSTNPPTNDPSSRSSHKSIKIGLGVSVPLLLISLVTTAVYLWRKKRTPHSPGKPSPDMQIANTDYRGIGYPPPEIDNPSSYPGRERGELPAESGTMRTEMPASELENRRT